MIFYYLLARQISSMAITCNIENCIQCSSFSPDICLDCLLPYKLSSSGCHLTQEERIEKITNCEYYNKDQTCLKCIQGFHVFNRFCEADCQDDCICFEPYVCISQRDDQSAMVNQRNTQECESPCTTCSISDPTSCLECPEGYTLDGGKCRYCPVKNCEICRYDNYCVYCKEGMYPSGGLCYKCSSGCAECYTYSICDECKSGYSKSNNKCKDETTNTVGQIVGIVVGITFLVL